MIRLPPNNPPTAGTVQRQVEPGDQLSPAELENMRRVMDSMAAREQYNGDSLHNIPPIPPLAAAQPRHDNGLARMRELLLTERVPLRNPDGTPRRYRWMNPAPSLPMQSQTQYQPTYPRDDYPWRSRFNIQQPLSRSSSEPSAHILHTPRPPSPSPLLHKVFRLSCRSCNTFFTNRGMRVRTSFTP